MEIYPRLTARHISLKASCSLATLLLVVAAPAYGQQADDEDKSDRVVVTGSYLARDQAQLASPVEVIDAEEIAATGRVGIDDLLVFNTANTGSVGGVQDLADGGVDSHASRSANLRGLGAASTLVLLNSRRVASTEGYTNLVALTPTIEVSRVETILDGASALYGSDAIAGAVNVITDRNFDGMRVSGQYIDIDGAPAFNLQGMVGGGDDRFHAVLSASYEHQDNLQNADRRITNFSNLSGASHPGSFTVSARPVAPGGGDVIIDNGVNGPINYSQAYTNAGVATVTFADPYCGTPSAGGIFTSAPAGSVFPRGRCFFSYQADNPLIPETEVSMMHGTASYQLEQGPEVYAEGRYYHQESRRYGIGSFGITGNLTVPVSNPGNPFGVPVTILSSQFRVLGAGSPYRVQRDENNAGHFVVGVRDELGFLEGWDYDISYVWSRETASSTGNDTDVLALQNALNGFGGPNCIIQTNGSPAAGQTAGVGNCVYYSPFAKDDATNDPRTRYNILTAVTNGSSAEYNIGEALITGELFSLPGGPIGVALGANIRREYAQVRLDSAAINGRLGFQGRGLPGEGERDVIAEFIEVQLPVLDTLDVQLALRHEDYDLFTTTDPKIGINWRPLDSLAFRFSAGTAFRAPALAQTVSTAVTSFVAQTFDTHPPPGAAADPGTFRTINVVPNQNLQPEESTNYNAGVTWEPIDNLRLSVDYWRFEFEKQIAAESAQAVINDQGPGAIRDAAGNLLAVNIRSFNSGSTETDGVDLRGEYSFDWGPNTFTISDNATYINAYTVQVLATSPAYDVVGRRNLSNPGATAPQWRNNLIIGWENGGQSANITMRYVDSVLDDLGLPISATPTRTVDSWTVYDTQYSILLGKNERTRLSVGAINILDEEPPPAQFTGYLPTIHDALRRQIYMRLSLDL